MPKGICSWAYTLRGPAHEGATEHHWASEQGSLRADGVRLEVRKGGVFSGQWTLAGPVGTVAEAHKPSAFRRRFEIEHASGRWRLEPAGLGRTMILHGPAGTATIAPAHAFTRRASIDGEAGDFAVTCFGFWLTVLMWRRAANSSGAAANSN